MALTSRDFVRCRLCVRGPSVGRSPRTPTRITRKASPTSSEGKTDEAIKALEQAVAANPKHGMAWASLGSLYKPKKDIPKAIDAYEHATPMITKDKVLWAQPRHGVRRNKQERSGARGADHGVQARSEGRRDSRQARHGAAQEATTTPARSATSRSRSRSSPTTREWWHNLGVAYRFAKRDDDAIKVYEKAIALAPNEARYPLRSRASRIAARKIRTRRSPSTRRRPASIRRTPMAGSISASCTSSEHENDKAIAAWQQVPRPQQGQGRRGQKRIEEEMAGIGGTAARRPPERAEEDAAGEEARRQASRSHVGANRRPDEAGRVRRVVGWYDADQLVVGRGDRGCPPGPDAGGATWDDHFAPEFAIPAVPAGPSCFDWERDHRARRARRARLPGRARAGLGPRAARFAGSGVAIEAATLAAAAHQDDALDLDQVIGVLRCEIDSYVFYAPFLELMIELGASDARSRGAGRTRSSSTRTRSALVA